MTIQLRRVAATNNIDIASFIGMSATRVRRRRGTPITPSYFRLDPDVKAKIDEYSERFCVPTWAIVEAAIRNSDPATWDLPEATGPSLFDESEEAAHQRLSA